MGSCIILIGRQGSEEPGFCFAVSIPTRREHPTFDSMLKEEPVTEQQPATLRRVACSRGSLHSHQFLFGNSNPSRNRDEIPQRHGLFCRRSLSRSSGR